MLSYENAEVEIIINQKNEKKWKNLVADTILPEELRVGIVLSVLWFFFHTLRSTKSSLRLVG